MTWTVTALGTAGTSTTVTTPVTSLVSGTISISVGDGIAVFCQYTDFGTDTLTITDSSGLNTWVANVDNLVDATNGEGLSSFYCLSAAHAATTITVGTSPSKAVIQSFGIIKFTNSVSGAPTLDGHSGHDNTVSTTTPNSGAGNSTNGDLVLTAIISDTTADSVTSLAITGVTTTTVRNNQETVAGYADGSGVTTTGGVGSVTSTWTMSASRDFVVLEMIFAPPVAGGIPLPAMNLSVMP